MCSIVIVLGLLLIGQLLGFYRVTPNITLPNGVSNPVIESFTCAEQRCLSGHACANFHWSIRGADYATFQMGGVDERGFFTPYYENPIPASVATNAHEQVRVHIGSYAAQVCGYDSISGNFTCAVCNPNITNFPSLPAMLTPPPTFPPTPPPTHTPAP